MDAVKLKAEPILLEKLVKPGSCNTTVSVKYHIHKDFSFLTFPSRRLFAIGYNTSHIDVYEIDQLGELYHKEELKVDKIKAKNVRLVPISSSKFMVLVEIGMEIKHVIVYDIDKLEEPPK